MKTDMQDMLALEVKKEIADRYFGFRKLIEEDSLELSDQIKQHSFILEKRISFDLIRIYLMLSDPELIRDFLDLIGLDEHLFYDPYLTESLNIRRRVFEGQRLHGFTRARRFRHLLLDCYQRLYHHVNLYRQKYWELMEFQESISEEIELFYQKNDLGSIMGFLRGLGNPEASGAMQGGMETGIAADLDKKLRIQPPRAVEQHLAVLPPLPDPQAIKKPLRRIIDRAYAFHGKEFMASCDFSSGRPSPSPP